MNSLLALMLWSFGYDIYTTNFNGGLTRSSSNQKKRSLPKSSETHSSRWQKFSDKLSFIILICPPFKLVYTAVLNLLVFRSKPENNSVYPHITTSTLVSLAQLKSNMVLYSSKKPLQSKLVSILI